MPSREVCLFVASNFLVVIHWGYLSAKISGQYDYDRRFSVQTGKEGYYGKVLTLQATIFLLVAVGFMLKRIGLIGPQGQKT